MNKLIPHKISDGLVLCVGAPRTGTTSLYELMSRHPQVSATKFKESHFFSKQKLYSSGCKKWVKNGFFIKADHKLFFDADPLYMYQTECLERIKASSEDAKIIIMLRSPVERAFSEYLTVRRHLNSALSFRDICNGWLSPKNNIFTNPEVIDRSLYTPWIKLILKNFPQHHLHFILFDDFISDMQAEFSKLQIWLNLTVADIGIFHENMSAAPRSRLLAKLISHPRYALIRNFLGFFIPGYTVRRLLVELILQLNSKSYSDHDKPCLDYNDVPDALKQVFHQDLLALQGLIAIDLSHWINTINPAITSPTMTDLRAMAPERDLG